MIARGVELSDHEVEALRQEDDSVVLNLDGDFVGVEKNSFIGIIPDPEFPSYLPPDPGNENNNIYVESKKVTLGVIDTGKQHLYMVKQEKTI